MAIIPADSITSPEAVAARAKITSDYELEREFGDYKSFELWNGPALRSYLSRELSVCELHRKLIEGSIVISEILRPEK